LQGFPDKFYYNCISAGVSESQIYKQAGNSITVNVMMEILKGLSL
jgi:DNA (cytosine-5)-methyltransferase 1